MHACNAIKHAQPVQYIPSIPSTIWQKRCDVIERVILAGVAENAANRYPTRFVTGVTRSQPAEQREDLEIQDKACYSCGGFLPSRFWKSVSGGSRAMLLLLSTVIGT